jgi:hypothetical protein
LNPISLVWDVQFTGEGVTQKATNVMLVAMNEHIQHPIVEVMNHNRLHEGQKVSRAGYTSGLRFIIDVTFLDVKAIVQLNNQALSFNHEFCSLSSVSISETLPIPLDIPTKSRFPELGRIMLCVRFTDGLGYTDAKKIRNAIGTQTKETKDGLDPIGTGKGSSGARFSEEFRSMLSDSKWLRRFPSLTGVSKGLLSGAAAGGCYDLSYDLREAVRQLTESSEEIWWSKLDPDELTLTPSLLVDPSEKIGSKFDPANYHHLEGDKSDNLVENMKNVEMEQTGDSDIVEDLTYTLDRMMRGRRIRKQVGVNQGLAHGNESFVISENVILPWIAEEFVNCLGFFLMTRKPKYWRNGQCEVRVVQPFSSELIEVLKEAD